MPPSQLKRLKTSLREAGVTGPEKSKKQKKNSRGSNNHVERHAKLQNIRDSFNPFELRAVSARPSKHQHASDRRTSGKLSYKDVLHRPGVTKSAGEELRRAKLLPEMQRRNKVGGLIDRRIGEGDTSLTAEETAEERFRAGFGRKSKNLFDLEESDEDEPMQAASRLMHGGKSIDDLVVDDFNEDLSDKGDDDLLRHKRKRSESLEREDESGRSQDDQGDDQPDHKKTKKEVMEEVIAKSKYHKYERQKAKEDDDDLREQLDKDVPDLLSLLQNHKPKQQVAPAQQSESLIATNGDGPIMNPERQKLLNGTDRAAVDKEYEARLRQLAQDAKAKPSERTKTAEEKAAEEAERLRNLEERRTRRMRGEVVDDGAEEPKGEDVAHESDDDAVDEAAEFGFTASRPVTNGADKEQIVLEDEDEFALDENLVASDSDVDLSEDESEPGSDDEDQKPGQPSVEDEEDEFVKDIFGDEPRVSGTKSGSGLAYTYPCPRSHPDLLDLIKDVPAEQLPTIIQRIRALHHPSLSAINKEAMADFSVVLVAHLSHMGLTKQPLQGTEQVIRHLHSLSRTYPERIANAIRAQLQSAHERKDFHAGDLIILTAIGSIYPTSDQWHQVVTPAMTLVARWLGMNAPDDDEKRRKGAYLVALAVNYQRLSKRFVPEALRFTLRALKSKHNEDKAHTQNLMVMADLWKDKPAFIEMFRPALPLFKSLNAKKEHSAITILLNQSRLHRRPVELHHHRPLPIRTSIPKFEEGFNPDKHYDPDKERTESRKLQKEYKRERKGALRELRKDSNFIAREQLREKREKDAEYEKKYRRLVAEVQGEAGHDAKEYAREKNRRKGKR